MRENHSLNRILTQRGAFHRGIASTSFLVPIAPVAKFSGAKKMWAVGIDGGGTNTKALLENESGTTIARSQAGPSNPNSFGLERAAANLATAIEGLSIPVDADLKIFAGVAGIVSDELAESLREATIQNLPWLRGKPFALTHDLAIAWSGAFDGASGICAIAGTGSACYAKTSSGKSLRISGRAEGRDDPGSGYAIAAEAIRRGIVQAPEGALAGDRASIAAFAPMVLEAAARGDQNALQLLRDQVKSLAHMIDSCRSLFGDARHTPLAVLGGLAQNELFRTELERAVHELSTSIQFVAPLAGPLHGAIRLARSLGEQA